MKKYVLLFLFLSFAANAQQVPSNSTISQLPQPSFLPLPLGALVPVSESGTTVQATLSQIATTIGAGSVTWPARGDLVISNGTSAPAGLPEADGSCALGAAGVWTTGSCGGGSPGGTSGQLQYNNAGSFGGFTMSGDATIVASTGVITVSKATSNFSVGGDLGVGSGLPFTVAGATGNVITSGTISSGQITADLTGNVTGSVNGVSLTTGGSSSTFLNGAGSYTTPSGGGSVSLTAGNTGIVVSPSPITGTGTISLGNPSASTLGGVESITAVTHNFLTSISTSGVPTQAQPAFGDISGNIALSQMTSIGSNTVIANVTASSTVPTAATLPTCADSSGNHLNYTLGTGFSCGTTDSHVGTVTSVATSAPLSGGAITSSGTISITGAAGQVLAGASPAFTATPVLGVNASAGGTLGLANGGTNGTTITIQNLGNITTGYNYNLPITAGSVGAIETSGGGGSTSNVWLSDAATGQILTSGGATTIPAYSATLPAAVQGNITTVGTVTSGVWSGTALVAAKLPADVAYLDAIQAWTNGQAVSPTVVSISTATFTPDFSASNNFSITLVHASCPCTIANPSNIVAGQSGVIAVVQSATGSDLVNTWGTDYVFTNTNTPVLSTAISATDYLSYYVVDSTHVRVSFLPATYNGPEAVLTYAPGLLTTITNVYSHFTKFVKASTVDNVIASAMTLTTCGTNPTILVSECGSSTTCTSPTTIASIQVTATGTATPATISSPAVAAGDYVAWQISGGTCAAVDVGATMQFHANN